MRAPHYLLQAALNRLGARFGSGLADTAATLAVLAQDVPRRLRQELDLFREEVEREAERLERGETAAPETSAAATHASADPAPGGSAPGGASAASPAGAADRWPRRASADPQDQIDALRARVAELGRRLERPPGGGSASPS
jgi:hypothetical protein